MKRPRQHVMEDASGRLFHSLLPEEWIVRPILKDYGVDFEVESYLRYRGNQFVSRFDANSYLYITKAEDYFDLTNGTGRLVDAFKSVDTRFLVISFTSDWLYPSYQSQEIVRVLRRINGDVAYCDLQSNYGHDAFLVDVAEQTELVRGFLESTARAAEAA